MSRLQKFVEKGAYREARCGLRTRLATARCRSRTGVHGGDLNAGDEILQDPSLKDVFSLAIANGYAIAQAKT